MSIWEMSGNYGGDKEVFHQNKLLLKCIQVGLFCTNCYLVMNEDTSEGLIIDPGADPIKICYAIDDMGMVPVAILLTHGHFDHIMAVNELKRKYDIRVFILDAEAKLLADPALNSSTGLIRQPYTTSADVFLEDNDSVVLAGLTIKVIATPGHTVGGACYHLAKQKILFSGDTLFYESIGRSDLPTGDSDLLIQSIRTRLAVLPDDTFVLPGHGVTTSIRHEKRCNSYMRSKKYNE